MTPPAADLTRDDACLTSHILDAGSGRPASDVTVTLFIDKDGTFTRLKQATSNATGRFEAPLLMASEAEIGRYRLIFSVDSPFFDDVTVDFNISDVAAHHHVPLVLSPFGFSVYRGAPPHRAPSESDTPVTAAPKPAEGSAPMPGTDGAGLTVHAIDIAHGTGAGGLAVHLFGPDGARLTSLVTTIEGRTAEWLVAPNGLHAGSYELVFETGRYFAGLNMPVGSRPFFETARVRFRVIDPTEHHHLPLIVAPWGYSFYRGS